MRWHSAKRVGGGGRDWCGASLTLRPVFELDLTANQRPSHSPSAVIPHWNRHNTSTRTQIRAHARMEGYQHDLICSLAMETPSQREHPVFFSTIEWAKWGLTFGIWTLPRFSLLLKGWELFPLFDMCVSLRTTWKDQSRAPGRTPAPDSADMSGMSLRTQCRDKKMIYHVYGKQWHWLHFWGECSDVWRVFKNMKTTSHVKPHFRCESLPHFYILCLFSCLNSLSCHYYHHQYFI